MEKSDLSESDIESLKTVANADCSASWIARKLLESFELDTSETTPEPEETPESSTEPTESEASGSVFAY